MFEAKLKARKKASLARADPTVAAPRKSRGEANAEYINIKVIRVYLD